MSKTPQLSNLEKSVRKALFYQRLRWGSLFSLFTIAVAVTGFWGIRHRLTDIKDVAVYTNIDKESPSYWSDRVEQDIAQTRALKLPEKDEQLRMVVRLRKTLTAAAAVSEGFSRSVAVSDTALAIFKHDIDVNVDEFLDQTGETPLAMAIRAKVLIAYALMLLRINNQVAATVAMNAYERIVNQADLKLDSDPTEWAFCGAVKFYWYTRNMNALDDLFRLNLKYTPRIVDNNLRLKAYRIIATEQARIGRDRDAMETATQITNSVESVRAFQGIIVNIARPTSPDLSNPSVFLPPSIGPWEPISISNSKNAKRVMNDVIRVIASHDTVSDQVELLSRLACSRMVCDPYLYDIYKSCLLESDKLSDNVKRPILAKLQNPESDAIRVSLKMPPLAKKKSSDPALDDWSSSFGETSVDLAAFDPNAMKEIINLEWTKIRLNIARSFLIVNRRMDVIRSLQDAVKIADSLKDVQDRITYLLEIAAVQISAGDIAGVQLTFQKIGLPRRGNGKATWISEAEELESDADARPRIDNAFTESSIARLARLKVQARFFSDAEMMISYLPSGPAKNSEYVFLVTELIRSQRLKEATGAVVNMGEGPRQNAALNRLAIAKGGGEEHYKALGLTFPQEGVSDNDLASTAQSLYQYGLYDAAAAAAASITDKGNRDAILGRIVKDIMLFFSNYGDVDADHITSRKNLFDVAVRVLEKIESPQSYSETMETILSIAVPAATNLEDQEALQPLFTKAFERCREIASTDVAKAECLAKIVTSNILLYAKSKKRPPHWPMLNKELDAPQIDEVRKILAEAIEIVNESNDDLGRALAMSSIARCLGLIGNTAKARQIADNVVEIAQTLNNKRQSILLVLSVVPTLQAMGHTEAVRTTMQAAFRIAEEVSGNDQSVPDAGGVFELKLRDSEIDRLIRFMLENDDAVDAVSMLGRIRETRIKDQLLQIAFFRSVDKEEYGEAEATARKIFKPNTKEKLLRDLAFVQKHREPKP